jgi:hypothetical protein
MSLQNGSILNNRYRIVKLLELASGFALLVHIASMTQKKQLALKYFKRMLEINPENPGHARQAARKAGIVSDAKVITRNLDIPWKWWEY